MTEEPSRATGAAESARVPLSDRAAWLLLLISLAWFLWTGARGLDFGEHWDEGFQVRLVERSIEEETLLPDWYNYPSVSYWLALAAIAPEALGADYSGMKTRGPLGIGEPVQGIAPVKQELTQVARDPNFLLRMRGVFLCVSALAILGVYSATRRRGGPWESLFAAGLIATSWEVSYHARWVAPDMILAALVALYMVSLLRAYESKGCLLSTALLAGLATGTKYTAGLLLLPILLLWWRTPPERDPKRLVGSLAAFTASFLASTPGAVLQPLRFWRDVAFERFHYGEAGHYGFGVDAGLEHLGLMMRWISTALASPYAPVALLVSFLALVGAFHSWRRDPVEAALLLLVPVSWVLFFSTQKVLFVRNLLPIAPFLALFAARGLSALGRSMTGRARTALGLIGASILAVNAAWGWEASSSIGARRAETRDDVAALMSWIERERGDRTLFFSEPLAREVYALLGEQPDWMIVDQGATADLAAFRPAEVAIGAFPRDPAGTLESNLPGALVTSFGPLEVNWEWYTTWREPRIVVIQRRYLEPLQKKQASEG